MIYDNFTNFIQHTGGNGGCKLSQICKSTVGETLQEIKETLKRLLMENQLSTHLCHADQQFLVQRRHLVVHVDVPDFLSLLVATKIRVSIKYNVSFY